MSENRIPSSSTSGSGRSWTRFLRPWQAWLLLLVVATGLQSCDLQDDKQAPQPSTAALSGEIFARLAREYGFDVTKDVTTHGIRMPFHTEAEARTYLQELRATIDHKSDGRALKELEKKYMSEQGLDFEPAPVQISRIQTPSNIFQNSAYTGYRYVVLDKNAPSKRPLILEVLVKQSSVSGQEVDALAARLYENMKSKTQPAGDFSGYAFLYSDKYQRIRGNQYTHGVMAQQNASITRYKDQARKGQERPTGCVRWMDYYVNGQYVTSTCLEYADFGDIYWGGSGDYPYDPYYDPYGYGGGGGSGTGGGGGCGGCGGGGGGNNPQPVEPILDEYGNATLTGSISLFSSYYVYFEYNNNAMSAMTSGFAGGAGFDTWEQIGAQGRGANHVYSFDYTFKITVKIDDFTLRTWGPEHIRGTYNAQTGAHTLVSPF